MREPKCRRSEYVDGRHSWAERCASKSGADSIDVCSTCHMMRITLNGREHLIFEWALSRRSKNPDWAPAPVLTGLVVGIMVGVILMLYVKILAPWL